MRRKSHRTQKNIPPFYTIPRTATHTHTHHHQARCPRDALAVSNTLRLISFICFDENRKRQTDEVRKRLMY